MSWLKSRGNEKTPKIGVLCATIAGVNVTVIAPEHGQSQRWGFPLSAWARLL